MTGPPQAGEPKRDMSGYILRLARRLRKDPEALAAQIPADTLRRTKYGMIEEEQPDGTILFRHDPGIVEPPRSNAIV